jgi:hypothetical protein
MSRLVRGSARADSISLCLAGACAMHCVGAPFVAGILPVVGVAVGDPRLEWLFLVVSLFTSAIALCHGCLRNHRKWYALAPYAAGAGCLLGIRLTADAEGALALILVMPGAALLIAAHIINIRLCRRAGADRCGRASEIRTDRTPADRRRALQL